MTNQFNIRFTMRTVAGFEPLCDFYIGKDRNTALQIFNQLESAEELDASAILQLDFVEIMNGLPVCQDIKHCSLQQLAGNCKMITKEVFKHRNLEQG